MSQQENNVQQSRTADGQKQAGHSLNLQPGVAVVESALAARVGKLWDGEDILQRVMDNSHDCIELLDLEGRLLWMNTCGLRGREIEDIQPWLNSYWLDCWIGEDRPLAETALIRARNGRAGSFAGYSPTVNGAAKWWEVVLTPVLSRAGHPEKILSIASDITERVQAEAEVRKLAAFPELNPNPVLAFAADGSLAYFNPAALAMAQSAGYGDMAAMLPAGIRQIVSRCLVQKESDLRVETKHGRHTLKWSFYPITAQSLVHCYVSDITDRLQLEEQFRQAQKMEAIGQLSGGIAHDFNNLLTAIIGHLGLLRDNPQLTPEIDESLQEISSAASRAAKLTSQLLMFSRRQPMSLKALELNDVVTQLSKMLHRILGEDVNLQLDFAPPPLIFHGDVGMIDQVLVNLAVNARDAMPEGGTLRIVTHHDTLTPRTITMGSDSYQQTDFIRLTVSDTGIGMPPEVQAKIFEPFFTTKDVGKGTGLGLATVFGIVQQHHGWIEVDSVLGQGTAFHIFLPQIKEGALPAVDVSPQVTPKRGCGELVLLVEDEATVREIGVRALGLYGYRVITANNGPEAIRVWAEHKADIKLLLTDMVMPEGLTGVQLAKHLRRENPSLRVVYSSGYNSKITTGSDLVLAEGVNYLAKPYELNNLLKTVRAALDAEPGPGLS